MIPKLNNLTYANERYRLDPHRFILVTSGRRSRKTLIGKKKMLTRSMQTPGGLFRPSAPTMGQAINIFWDDLKEWTTGIRKDKSETYHRIKLLNDAVIQLTSLEKPQRVEGIPCHGYHITEFADIKEKAWSAHIRPTLSDTLGWAILDGVPEGRNHYYKKVLKTCGGAIPTTKPMIGGYSERDQWSYHNWFSADVLDAQEIEEAKDDLDEKTFLQEYEGSFEGVDGLAYYKFGHWNIDNGLIRDPNAIVHVAMDFNVDPMTACFCHIDKNERLLQFGEAYFKDSNTENMGLHVRDLFGTRNTYIYPDSTGVARDSTSATTDLKILRSMGFKVFARLSNPRVKDRVNIMNSRLKSMNGIVKYKVNEKNCPHTVNDFNMVERLPDGTLNNKQEAEGLKHITDGLGYLTSYKWLSRARITTR